MLSRARTGIRLAVVVLALGSSQVALLGCSGSAGGFSGKYEAKMEDGKFEIDFTGGNKATVSIIAPDGQQLSHHCVYTIDGKKITFTTDEPMGAPMTLEIDGDTLTDGMVVYRKQ